MATIKLGKGRAKVTGMNPDGTQFRKTYTRKINGDNYKALAQIKYNELLIEKSEFLDPQPLKMAMTMQAMTIAQLGELYIKEHLRTSKASGNASYVRVIIEKWGDRTLMQISKLEVRSWIGLYIEGVMKKPWGKPYGAHYARKLAIYFVRLYNWAIESDIVDRNPLAGLIDMKKKKDFAREIVARDVIISPRELLRIMRVSPEWFRRIIRHAWDTGMREGEIVLLTWGKVKDEGYIALGARDDKETAKKRVYLTPRIIAQLDRIKAENLINGVEIERVYLGGRGLPIKPVDVSDAWRRSCRKAGVVDRRFHDLRRTYTVRKELAGHRLAAIAAQLGHKSVRTTVENYRHVSEEEMRGLAG